MKFFRTLFPILFVLAFVIFGYLSSRDGTDPVFIPDHGIQGGSHE